jgi:hypothetical protein
LLGHVGDCLQTNAWLEWWDRNIADGFEGPFL